MTVQSPIRLKAAATLAALSLLLSACFVTPGKFTSQLQLTGEDTFSFKYDGEIFFLGMASLAEMGAAANEFVPTECYDDDTYEERDCTSAELADQRSEWDAGAEARAAKAKEEAEQFSAMMGGIDPTDPEAAEKLRQLLLRHKGWERVEDKGEGVFDVSYSISGTLSHDFQFPVLEGIPMTNPFVEMVLRDGNVVRINAPGFAAQHENNPMGSMMGSMFGMGAMAGMSGAEVGAGESIPDLPVIEGTFSIVTDGAILANNTDEGPSASSGGQTLTWSISPRTKSAPTALINVSR